MTTTRPGITTTPDTLEPDPGAITGLFTGLTFVAAIAGATKLAKGPIHRPGAPAAAIREYYHHSAPAVRFSVAGQAISIVPWPGSTARSRGSQPARRLSRGCCRQLTWAATDVTMFHWQDRSGAEVDIILEAADGRVAGLEVKTGQTAKPEWFRWLRQMRDAIADKFMAGIALYAGNDVLPFGDRLLAVPISALWEL